MGLNHSYKYSPFLKFTVKVFYFFVIRMGSEVLGAEDVQSIEPGFEVPTWKNPELRAPEFHSEEEKQEYLSDIFSGKKNFPFVLGGMATGFSMID